MIDFAEIARAAFDRPLAPDERAALRVWADQLEAAGDPRGGLIAIEHGEGPLWDRPYRRTVAMAEHLLLGAWEEPHPQLGAFAEVLAVPRAAALDWRGGALYGAVLDTRHTTKLWKVSAQDLVARLVAMPTVSTLRRLVVRVGPARDVQPVLDALRAARARLPELEQLSVLMMPVPTRTSTNQARVPLVEAFPNLWLLAVRDAWWSFPAEGPPLYRDDDPADLAGRIRIGRALFVAGGRAPDSPHPLAAIERLQALGPRALPYRELFETYLMPRTETWGVPIVGAIRAVGALGIEGVPLRRRLARCGHREGDVRAALAAIDQAIAARDVPDSNRRDPP